MKKLWVVVAMMAACCTACSEDKDCAKFNGSERCDLPTEHGALICDSNVRYMNQNGTYNAYPCDAGYACVNDGLCTRMPECIDAAVPMTCNNNTLSYCSGGIMRYEACADHTICNIDATTGKGACVPKTSTETCEAGTERCDVSGMHQVCQDTGSALNWVNSPCATGKVCSAGACVLADPCIPNDTRCYYDKASDANIVQTCTSDKVWKTSEVCSGEKSACNAGKCVEPGSNNNNNNSGWYDCSAETCTMQDGTNLACGDACADAYGSSSYKAWCDASGNVQCSESQPSGGGNSGGGSQYTNCSAETCTMQDGSSMTCGDACEQFAGAGNEAWCTASGEVTCSPTDPSGSGGNSGSGSYYDCSTEACTQAGDTCVEFCNASGYTTDKAWCDDQYVYCSDPNGSGSGGGGGGGTSSEPTVDKNSCNLSNLSSITPFGTCTAANLDCEVHVCWEDAQYDGYFTEYLVCMDLSEYGKGNMWYPLDGIYMQCNNKCDASAQSCDSKGGEYGAYQ